MSGFNRKDGGAPPANPPEADAHGVPHRSGRTTFDDRGRAVWEWQVQTGSFDLNADSQRVRALTDVELSLEEPEPLRRPGFKEEGFSPYGSEPAAPARRPTGANPDSAGAAKRPEAVSYDPHRTRPPPARPVVPPPPAPKPAARQGSGSNPYGAAEPPAKKSFNPFNAFKLGAAKKPPR